MLSSTVLSASGKVQFPSGLVELPCRETGCYCSGKEALPKAKWRFLARYEDGEEVWLSWREADPLAALDDYAEAHPELKIPAR